MTLFFFFCMLNRTKTSEKHGVFTRLFSHQELFSNAAKKKAWSKFYAAVACDDNIRQLHELVWKPHRFFALNYLASFWPFTTRCNHNHYLQSK